MKKVIVLIGVILLIANIIFGLILTKYQMFNICTNCIVIFVNSLLLYCLQELKIKQAFTISLSFMFSVLGVVEFVLGSIAPKQFENNWYLLIVIVLLAFEGIFLVITHKTSQVCKS